MTTARPLPGALTPDQAAHVASSPGAAAVAMMSGLRNSATAGCRRETKADVAAWSA